MNGRIDKDCYSSEKVTLTYHKIYDLVNIITTKGKGGLVFIRDLATRAYRLIPLDPSDIYLMDFL